MPHIFFVFFSVLGSVWYTKLASVSSPEHANDIASILAIHFSNSQLTLTDDDGELSRIGRCELAVTVLCLSDREDNDLRSGVLGTVQCL